MNAKSSLQYLALLWLPLWVALIPTWRFGTYYEFGWLVPPATLFFAWNRLRAIPMGASTMAGSAAGTRRPVAAFTILALAGAVGGLVVFRALELVDPTWRRVLVPHALLIAALTFAGLALKHGRALAVYFLPVIVFALTAVPLPSSLEQGVIRTFTGAVVGFSAEILRLVGQPITISGDALVSFSGRVAVTEGCSGLRSFQGLFMASLFFGELHRLKWRWRGVLIVAGAAFGMLTNVARAVTLSLLSMNHGKEAFDRWHDALGHAAFCLAIGALFLVARGIESKPRSAESWAGARAPESKSRPAAGGGRVRGAAIRCGIASLGFCLLATVGVELVARGWYRAHRPGSADQAASLPSLDLPENGLQALDLRDNPASKSLHYDEGDWLVIAAEDRRKQIVLFRFEYRPDNPSLFMDVTSHSPEDCMASRGFAVEARFPQRVLAADGAEIAFESLSFRPDPADPPMFVFKTRFISGEGSIHFDAVSYRLRLALTGQRRPSGSAMVLLASVTGYETEREAWEFFVEKVFGGKASG